MQFNFNYKNRYAENGTTLALTKLIPTDKLPLIVCIGTEKISGDALGPIVGTMIRQKLIGKGALIFGTLDSSITAKEVKYLNYFFKATFGERKIITVDAALGKEEEVGLIKISDSPLKPGSGIDKKLDEIGNVTIQGVVAEKTPLASAYLQNVKIDIVYKMAEIISSSGVNYIYQNCKIQA